MGIFRILAIAVCCAVIGLPESIARGPAPSATQEIAASKLPAEAQSTLVLIRNGGPFAYSRDGVVFGNRERLLPQKPRGHYHEYTVKTPGEATRGAKRIICGGDVAALDECYYTDDHYQSFRRIRR
jgi:ribonuclease T1